MTKGRLALVNGPEFEYCRRYHCAGDCGLPHNQEERAALVRYALNVFDSLGADERAAKRDEREAVRRRAKDAL